MSELEKLLAGQGKTFALNTAVKVLGSVDESLTGLLDKGLSGLFRKKKKKPAIMPDASADPVGAKLLSDKPLSAALAVKSDVVIPEAIASNVPLSPEPPMTVLETPVNLSESKPAVLKLDNLTAPAPLLDLSVISTETLPMEGEISSIDTVSGNVANIKSDDAPKVMQRLNRQRAAIATSKDFSSNLSGNSFADTPAGLYTETLSPIKEKRELENAAIGQTLPAIVPADLAIISDKLVEMARQQWTASPQNRNSKGRTAEWQALMEFNPELGVMIA